MNSNDDTNDNNNNNSRKVLSCPSRSSGSRPTVRNELALPVIQLHNNSSSGNNSNEDCNYFLV